MSKSLTFALILLYLLGLSSCNQPVESNTDSTPTIISVKDDLQSYPVWNVISNKTVFIFEDKQNLIAVMRYAGVDSVLLSRTTISHSDSSQWSMNHIGEWIVPSYEVRDTLYNQITGIDTMMYIRETMTYPIEAFKLRRE